VRRLIHPDDAEPPTAREQLSDLPMFRAGDPGTSKAAAASVEAADLGKIQRLVMAMFRTHGPMSARTAEQLPEAEPYGFSTIRKRISELAAAAYLVARGTEGHPPATVYVVNPDKPCRP
jgi:hypothetical protein